MKLEAENKVNSKKWQKDNFSIGVNPYAVYTTTETQKVLKISESTIKRMLKNKLIRANKVGGQYRILGKELLRIVSPSLEKEAVKSYLGLKKKVVSKINKW
jgi:excisionase family DNA binding protein